MDCLKRACTRDPKNRRATYWLPSLILLLFITLTVAARIRLLDFPLERDEGEYAYAGQLMLQGVPPYQLAYTMKLPGTHAIYALMMAIFGQTTVGIHFGLLLANSAATVLVFLLGRRLLDARTGIVAAASYALLSASDSVLGMAAHATHFVVLAALAGTLLLLKAADSGRVLGLVWAGILFGLAFVIKQHGIFFAGFAIAYLISTQWVTGAVNWSRAACKVAALSLGVFIPFGLLCLFLWQHGVFPKFWFWTFVYARQYESLITPLGAVVNFIRLALFLKATWLFWIVAGAGLALVYRAASGQNLQRFVSTFVPFSVAAVIPGFYFRKHYVILLLPAVSILVGVAVSGSCSLFRSVLPLWAFVIVCLSFLAAERSFFFSMSPVQASRSEYPHEYFPEAREIARRIRSRSTPDTRIAVLGSEPQIYFYSRRRSATGYIYVYGFGEKQPYAAKMQKEMIREIEAARPEYLVYVSFRHSWWSLEGGPSNLPDLISSWKDKYCAENYRIVGVVDVRGSQQTEYRWGDGAVEYSPLAPNFFLVYKRKDLL